VAGGSSTSSARPSQTSSMATIWDSQGPRSLHDILSSGGADLTGWVALNNVQSISADGRTVCGNGWFDADGSGSGAATQMGFVAQIPEPSTSLLVGGLMLSLLMVRQGSFKPLPAISDRSRKP
jgi:hypothetical protein